MHTWIKHIWKRLERESLFVTKSTVYFKNDVHITDSNFASASNTILCRINLEGQKTYFQSFNGRTTDWFQFQLKKNASEIGAFQYREHQAQTYIVK